MKTTLLHRLVPSPLRAAASALGLLALVFAGCEGPGSRQPIGSRSVQPEESRLAGTWTDADGKPWHVHIADPAAGRLEVATIELRDGNRFELDRSEVLLREENGVQFYNARPLKPAPEPADPFRFGRILTTDNALILFPAGIEPVRQLILTGAIGGEVTTNHANGGESYEVIVTNRYDRLARELAAPNGWQMLDTTNPLVFTRPPKR